MAGLYGGLIVALLLRLANTSRGPERSWPVEAPVATAASLRRRTAPQAVAAGVARVALRVSLRVEPPSGVGTVAAGTLRDPGGAAPVSTALSGDRGAAPSSSATGGGSAAVGRRLLLLNFDGADLDTILTMQAQGKLPGFSRLVQEGSYGRLASIGPCVAPVTRTTLVTGMLPYRHGVRSDQVRSVLGRPPRFDIVPPGIGFDLLLSPVLERRASSVSDRRSQAFWEISGRQGGRGEAAGWDIDLDDARAEWAEVSTDGAQK